MSSWVAARFGIAVVTSNELSPVEVALRRNPARAQLLVSPLLGKHVPVTASAVLAAGGRLGARVAPHADAPAVLGFAETATGLGHAVAAAIGRSAYVHSTRRSAPIGAVSFLEEHSHAVEQTVPDLPPGDTLVLVDDELSTGRTALNAIRSVHARWPRPAYVLAQLLDSRTEAQRTALAAEVRSLGAALTTVSLTDAVVHVPAGSAARVAALAAEIPEPDWCAPVEVRGVRALEFSGLPTGTWRTAEATAAGALAAAIARSLELQPDARTLVLGDEEFLYLPQLIAAALGPQVCTSSTTRSPAIALDEPGYPLRTVLRFPSTHDKGRCAYAYNVAPSVHLDPGNAPGFDDVVLVTDGHPSDGLVGRLQQVSRLHLVRVC